MTSNFARTGHAGVRSIAVFLSALMALFSISAHAVKQTGGEFNTLYAGIGAKGYDVVSYFTDGKPIIGKEDLTSEYGGVTWRFSSTAHRDLFAANPAKYAPQYGGFCSWGVGEANRLFDVDPVNGWTIFEGKLFLNFNGDINQTFRNNPAGIISKAEKNWPGLNH
jgi:YHS domain-containing protein